MEEVLNRGDKNFTNCKPTVNFIRKINSLVDVLNSNTEKHDLHADPKSRNYKVNILSNIHIFRYIFILLLLYELYKNSNFKSVL